MTTCIACARCMRRASYVTVNISSPNTTGLRELQQDACARLAAGGTQGGTGRRLRRQHGKYTPLVVKIAPDLSAEEIARWRARC